MKRYVLFASDIMKKESEKCMFQGWIFKKQGAVNIQTLSLGCCLPPIKISGYAPARGLHSAKASPMAQNDNYASGL